MPRGLKPRFVVVCNVWAKAQTYLRSKSRGRVTSSPKQKQEPGDVFSDKKTAEKLSTMHRNPSTRGLIQER